MGRKSASGMRATNFDYANVAYDKMPQRSPKCPTVQSFYIRKGGPLAPPL